MCTLIYGTRTHLNPESIGSSQRDSVLPNINWQWNTMSSNSINGNLAISNMQTWQHPDCQSWKKSSEETKDCYGLSNFLARIVTIYSNTHSNGNQTASATELGRLPVILRSLLTTWHFSVLRHCALYKFIITIRLPGQTWTKISGKVGIGWDEEQATDQGRDGPGRKPGQRWRTLVTKDKQPVETWHWLCKNFLLKCMNSTAVSVIRLLPATMFYRYIGSEYYHKGHIQ